MFIRIIEYCNVVWSEPWNDFLEKVVPENVENYFLYLTLKTDVVNFKCSLLAY